MRAIWECRIIFAHTAGLSCPIYFYGHRENIYHVTSKTVSVCDFVVVFVSYNKIPQRLDLCGLALRHIKASNFSLLVAFDLLGLAGELGFKFFDHRTVQAWTMKLSRFGLRCFAHELRTAWVGAWILMRHSLFAHFVSPMDGGVGRARALRSSSHP